MRSGGRVIVDRVVGGEECGLFTCNNRVLLQLVGAQAGLGVVEDEVAKRALDQGAAPFVASLANFVVGFLPKNQQTFGEKLLHGDQAARLLCSGT